jgi:hypothetical protein
MIERALATVSKGKRGAYQAALRLLDEDTLAAWDAEAVDEAEPDAGGYTRDADGLKESLEATRNWLESCIADAANAADVTEQAHGMAIDIRDLERIARIEAHLDAKLQRLLTLLRQSRKARPAIKG